MKIDLEQLNKRIDEKLISVQKHPTADLFIYNYTPVCQFGRSWDEYTMLCRGLILDAEGNVVARPFKKFFNYEENPTVIPDEPFRVFEKFDGSLGILYKVKDEYFLSTRGSFVSDQSIVGTQLLQAYIARRGIDWIDDNYTYLFEIIYPENRIVVNYGTQKRLVLLAKINTDTGLDADVTKVHYSDKVNEWYNASSIEQLQGTARENSEGYVILFESGLRVKLKHEEYVRLHRLLTQISSKSIWDLLRKGESLEPVLDNIPDEFYSWVKGVIAHLNAEFNSIGRTCIELKEAMPEFETRREMAEWVNKTRYPAVLFKMLDEKDYSDLIWKMVKPSYEQPFRKDIDT